MAKKPEEIIAKSTKKLQKLKDIVPFFIDLSLRENPVGARVGMTLEDKLAILPKLRASSSTSSTAATAFTRSSIAPSTS